MKKITHILTALVLTLGSFNIKAQSEQEKIDTIKIDLENMTVLVIKKADAADSSLTISLSDADSSVKHAEDYEWSGIDGFQFGAIGLFTKTGNRAFADRPDLALNTTR